MLRPDPAFKFAILSIMPLYETVLILKPVMSDAEVTEVLEKTKKTIGGAGGETLSQEIWGRRRLTHMIGKAREGVYAYLKFRGAASLISKLDNGFKVSDDVLRHSIFRSQERRILERPAKPRAVPAGATHAAEGAAPSAPRAAAGGPR